jgi:hypothetical protein
VLALALVFIGCSSGDSGTGSKAQNAFDQVSSDPVADGLAAGYVSTLAVDYSGNASNHSNVSQTGIGAEPVSRDVFQSPSLQGQAAPGQVGAYTLAPARPANTYSREAGAMVTAHAGPNDSIVLKYGTQTASIFPVSRNGQEHSFSLGSDGVITMGGESDYPKVVEAPGIGRAVILVSGNVVPVQE